MICIDTIEDKIFAAAQKILAKELIADDANFVKALSKIRCGYLFS
jgi:non-specific serine/threonine protein kinase